MKLAIIGSRSLKQCEIERYLPEGISEIVSGGAKGVDILAEDYARKRGIAVKVFLPDYRRYRKGAPLKRNEEIAEYADEAIAFWDGKSKGTAHTIALFRRRGKPVHVVLVEEAGL